LQRVGEQGQDKDEHDHCEQNTIARPEEMRLIEIVVGIELAGLSIII
jgi:hypothetical protein